MDIANQKNLIIQIWEDLIHKDPVKGKTEKNENKRGIGIDKSMFYLCSYLGIR